MDVASHGEDALPLLRASEQLPDLILLDLNMPVMDGPEFLSELKQDSAMRRIPVVVLTISDAQEDVESCYDLHASCYIQKPVTLDGLVETANKLDDFYLTMVRLPGRQGQALV